MDVSISGDIHLLISGLVTTEAQHVLEDKFPGHSHLLKDMLRLLDCEIMVQPSDLALESAITVLRDLFHHSKLGSRSSLIACSISRIPSARDTSLFGTASRTNLGQARQD